MSLWIVPRRACMFVDEEIATHPKTGEMMQVTKDRMTVFPTMDAIPVEVPDWVESDALFQLGIEEGFLSQVTEQSARAQIKRAEEKATADKQEKKPTGLQPPQGGGWRK